MHFNDELHEQLFALFITYSNSAHFNKMGGPNTEQGMASIIYLVSTEYKILWEDRCEVSDWSVENWAYLAGKEYAREFENMVMNRSECNG